MSQNLWKGNVYLTQEEYDTLVTTGTVTLASGETITYSEDYTYIVPEQYDSTPTAGSTNPVTSGGIKTALDGKANSSHTHIKEDITNFPSFPERYIYVHNIRIFRADAGEITLRLIDRDATVINTIARLISRLNTLGFTESAKLAPASGYWTESSSATRIVTGLFPTSSLNDLNYKYVEIATYASGTTTIATSSPTISYQVLNSGTVTDTVQSILTQMV